MIRSLILEEGALERHNLKLQEKFRKMKDEIRWEGSNLSDAEVVLVAFGTMARICKSVINEQRGKGLKVGLLRPITLWPFPQSKIKEIAEKARAFLVVEMNYGQMVEDVRLAVNGQVPVHFFGRGGGGIPTPDEISAKLKEII